MTAIYDATNLERGQVGWPVIPQAIGELKTLIDALTAAGLTSELVFGANVQSLAVDKTLAVGDAKLQVLTFTVPGKVLKLPAGNGGWVQGEPLVVVSPAARDEQQTVSFTGGPTGGTFKLTFNGQETAAITYSVTPATTAANIEAALNALSNLSGVAVTGIDAATCRVRFGGADGGLDQPLMTLTNNSLTGGVAPNASIAEYWKGRASGNAFPLQDSTGREILAGVQAGDALVARLTNTASAAGEWEVQVLPVLGTPNTALSARQAARRSLGILANEIAAAATTSVAITADHCGRLIPLDATAAAFTQALPAVAAVGPGFIVGFQKVDASYNAATLDGDAAEPIAGVPDFVLSDQGEAIWLIADAAGWNVLSYVPGTTLRDGVVIEERSFSGVAAVDFFKGWTTTQKFRRMVFDAVGLLPANTDSVLFRVSTDGSTFISTGVYYGCGIAGTHSSAPGGSTSNGTSALTLTGNVGVGATSTASGRVTVHNYGNNTAYKELESHFSGGSGSFGSFIRDFASQMQASALPILGARFLMAGAGNFSGLITQRGYR